MRPRPPLLLAGDTNQNSGSSGNKRVAKPRKTRRLSPPKTATLPQHVEPSPVTTPPRTGDHPHAIRGNPQDPIYTTALNTTDIMTTSETTSFPSDRDPCLSDTVILTADTVVEPNSSKTRTIIKRQPGNSCVSQEMRHDRDTLMAAVHTLTDVIRAAGPLHPNDRLLNSRYTASLHWSSPVFFLHPLKESCFYRHPYVASSLFAASARRHPLKQKKVYSLAHATIYQPPTTLHNDSAQPPPGRKHQKKHRPHNNTDQTVALNAPTDASTPAQRVPLPSDQQQVVSELSGRTVTCSAQLDPKEALLTPKEKGVSAIEADHLCRSAGVAEEFKSGDGHVDVGNNTLATTSLTLCLNGAPYSIDHDVCMRAWNLIDSRSNEVIDATSEVVRRLDEFEEAHDLTGLTKRLKKVPKAKAVTVHRYGTGLSPPAPDSEQLENQEQD